ncbi:hypothetical protein FOZ62_022819, partial [Perkinsus olseni]
PLDEVPSTSGAAAVDDDSAPRSICDETVTQLHGYLPGQGDTRLFFWFFESRNDPRSSPTVIYFHGGPGGSSLYAAVSGNGGPCIVDDDGKSTTLNKYSWNTHANVMYLDQPAGVGFSRGSIPEDSVEAAESTFPALSHFFASRPQYNTRVFLAGQSYAGRYVPPLATKLMENRSFVRLEGILLGNPTIAPEIEWCHHPRMLLIEGIISAKEYARVNAEAKDCVRLVHECKLLRESLDPSTQETYQDTCDRARRKLFNDLLGPAIRAGRQTSNLDKEYVPSEDDPVVKKVESFMNSETVQRFLEVDSVWQHFSWDVYYKFACDIPRSYHHFLPDLLHSGLRVLVYAGDRDLICNWVSNLASVMALPWKGGATLRRSVPAVYRLPDGRPIGDVRASTLPDTGGQLIFLKVHGAGHSVAMDAPEQALKMFDDFLSNKLH